MPLTQQRHKGVRAHVLYIHTSATYAAGGFIRSEYPSAPRARLSIETLPVGIKSFKCGDVSAPLHADLQGKCVCISRKKKKGCHFHEGSRASVRDHSLDRSVEWFTGFFVITVFCKQFQEVMVKGGSSSLFPFHSASLLFFLLAVEQSSSCQCSLQHL